MGDEWVGTLLLAGLLEEYRPIIMAFENSGAAITGDFVKEKLLQEVKIQVSPKNSDIDSAIYSKSGKRFKNTQKLKCYICNCQGHIAKYCRNKQNASSTFKSKEKGHPKRGFVAFNSSEKIKDNTEWFIDSGASSHMTNNIKLLYDVQGKQNSMITTANNEKLENKAIGKTSLKVLVNNNIDDIEAEDVLYVPEITSNLLSVSKIVEKGHIVTFNKKGCQITDEEGNIVAAAKESEGVYKLNQAKSWACITNTIENNEL